jgi:lantibiotic biosynthesis protein
MHTEYQLMPQVFLRAPFYSYLDYDLLRLPEVLGRQSFRNALYLASPVFYRELEKKGFIFEQLSGKEKHTLSKYYNRMCFRPTPFGLFSTFSLAEWGKAPALNLAEDGLVGLRLLADQADIYRLEQLFLQAFHDTVPVLNPTLYTAGGEYRFIRSAPDARGRYRFSLEAVRSSAFYRDLFRQVRSGTLNGEALIIWAAEQTGCSREAAEEQLRFLLDAQVLFTRAQGQLITGREQPDRYADLCLNLSPKEDLPAKAGPLSTGFYAAAMRPVAGGAVDETVRPELERALQVLDRLSPSSAQANLRQFIADFRARYDLEQVPLLQAIDPDTGISYAGLNPGPVAGGELEGLQFPGQVPATPSLEWEAVRRLFFRLWAGNERGPLTLRDSDLNELSGNADAGAKPSTLAVIFRRVADHLLIEHAGGATATALTGRFSLFSEEAHRLGQELAELEKRANPDILFADIGQLSDTHTDNINRRMQLYDYEIPVNVCSGLPRENQIDPEDLALSVRDGELVLSSLSRGKRVIPRLASAYNFRKNQLAVFRLLCDLQYQGLHAPRSLDLAQLFPGLSYYPRVTHGQTILSLARWEFSERDLEMLPAGADLAALRSFRERHGLPQRLSMGREDQQLVFDLADPEDGRFFIRCLQGAKKATCQEYLLPDRSIRKGFEPYAGQLVAFFKHSQPVYRPLSPEKHPARTGTARSFLPGSEWLYLQVYCTPRKADQLLSEAIWPLAQKLRDELPAWFFIRYTEGGHHLRLRFRVYEKTLGGIMVELNKVLKADEHERMIRDLRADTYHRELERYGPEHIDQVEAVFFRGSELACATLHLPPFRLALCTAFRMIAVFYPEMAAAANFAGPAAERFLLEFGGGKALRLSLDRKYRSLRPEIETWLETGFTDTLYLEPFLEQLEAMRKTAGQQDRLLADLIHMQLNRTFREDARKQELLVYFCLHRYLTAKLARRKADTGA